MYGEVEHLPATSRREISEVSEVEKNRQPQHPSLQSHLRLAESRPEVLILLEHGPAVENVEHRRLRLNLTAARHPERPLEAEIELIPARLVLGARRNQVASRSVGLGSAGQEDRRGDHHPRALPAREGRRWNRPV